MSQNSESYGASSPGGFPLAAHAVEEGGIPATELEASPAQSVSPASAGANQNIADDLRQIRERLDALDAAAERKDDIIKGLHEELQTYKSGIRREYIYPILKDIIRWVARVDDMCSHYKREIREDPSNAARHIPNLLKEYKNIALGLRDLVDDHGLVALEPTLGEKFDPRKHRRIGTEDTEDPAKDECIARVAGVGFADLETGRLLKQADVVVFSTRSQVARQ